MRGINNMKIRIKVQIATVTIILLFAVISVAAITLRTILTAQVGTTVAATEAALQINGLSNLVTAVYGRDAVFRRPPAGL